jgi:hypothetical protein
MNVILYLFPNAAKATSMSGKDLRVAFRSLRKTGTGWIERVADM